MKTNLAKIAKTKKLMGSEHKGQYYIGNGHWLLRADLCELPKWVPTQVIAKIAAKLPFSWDGQYDTDGVLSDTGPDVGSVLNLTSADYIPISATHWLHTGDYVELRFFQAENGLTIPIDEKYYKMIEHLPITTCGISSDRPLALYLNDDLVGLIMPVRFSGPYLVQPAQAER